MKIYETFSSLHQLINEHEAKLRENILSIETGNIKQLKDYETHLLNIQKSLNIQQTMFSEILSARQHIRLLQIENGSAEYINRTHKELQHLKSPPRTRYDIRGLEKLSEIKQDILQCGRIEQQINDSLAYENPQLEKKLIEQHNKQILDLSDLHLNGQDMKILAGKYRENTVRI